MKVVDIKNGMMSKIVSKILSHAITKKLNECNVNVMTNELSVDCDEARVENEYMKIHLDCDICIRKEDINYLLVQYFT